MKALDFGSDSLLFPKADIHTALPVFEYKDKGLGPHYAKTCAKPTLQPLLHRGNGFEIGSGFIVDFSTVYVNSSMAFCPRCREANLCVLF